MAPPTFSQRTWHDLPAVDTPVTSAIIMDWESALASLHQSGGVNAGDYTVGNGVADDAAAINQAIADTPLGGVTVLPPAVYGLASPVLPHPNKALVAPWAPTLSYADGYPLSACLRPLGSFSGAAAVLLRGKYEAGWSYEATGTRLRNITVDGVTAPAGTKGFATFGYVREATFDHCVAHRVPDNGWDTVNDGAATGIQHALSLRLTGCVADNCSGAGFSLVNCPDTTLSDCNAQGSGWVGYYLAGMPNGVLIGCRAEWSGQYGYYVTGNQWGAAQGSGGLELIACLTDRNNYDGLYVDAQGADVIGHTGCRFRRDGRNGGAAGGGYAAVRVAATATMPVIGTSSKTYPGVDDDGTHTNSPQYGLAVASGAQLVEWTGGELWGATAPTGGTGRPVLNGVALATGATGSPTRIGPHTPVMPTVATGDYQLAANDVDTIVEINSAAAHTVTVPANATVPFPVGAVIEVCQVGAGQVTFAGAAGVTLRTSSSLTARAQYSTVSLRQRAVNEWVLAGDLT